MKFGKIMSRIGKKEIIIPSGVEVKKDGDVLSVKGPLGELSRSFKGDLDILIENNIIKVSPKKELENLALWGTFASHISNMIDGVTKGFKKTLLIEGVGFKFQLEGANLLLNIERLLIMKYMPAALKILILMQFRYLKRITLKTSRKLKMRLL